MDFKQLNAFLTISKLQSFTKAADALGYAQSTITTQIKLLECELDVKLFERIGKTTTLTHEGKKLLPYAKQILKLSTDIKSTVSNENKPTGTLTIGAAESLCVLRLPEILKEYTHLYPDVDVSLKFGSCADFRHYLSENLIDVAFSLGVKIDSDEFISDVELKEPMLLLAYPGHDLINKKEIFPTDIKDESLILTETGCSYRAAFERILKDNGIKPNITLETGSVQAIKQFTMSGLGITFLPEIAVKDEVKAGKLIPLNWAGPDLNIISQVIYHKDKWISPALKEFISLSHRFLKQNL
ncbi:LysR family transcriptional regulator [Clostridium butyricum]|uniref:LysR family transcriptional regulator n=1 Tax=Clostridium butyricum TaxID=1492 RepID=UPI0013D2CE2B|nr:LysR family transcriptional regulator [Clostridium butyricum]MCQ2017798.1 LysR family transcriptional regulator [Clostridium butyricum]MCQ2021623.1 LysR family transcriptional regulator [Clostridium butyricum]NFB73541.1 LysR family transcriptional regulator [Clostridium butyricum]NFB90086.1 LysR family transcriptional regulator [Clostridium butyricum]UTY52939.1 LysR family transcriptional regulator [Clostridium butyricum]